MNWQDIKDIHRAAKDAAKGPKGRQRASKTGRKSRAKLWMEHKRLLRGKAGDIGTGDPLYSDPLVPRIDPEFRLAQWVMRIHGQPERWDDLPDAPDHEDLDE